MIVPILIYADKFAARQSIKHDQLFYMLLSRLVHLLPPSPLPPPRVYLPFTNIIYYSTVVCVKFWNDTPTLRNSTIAKAFNYSVKSVNAIERNFLKGIDYDLSLSFAEVLRYMQRITSAPYNSFSIPPCPGSSDVPASPAGTPTTLGV